MTFRQALRNSADCCFAGLLVGGYIASFVFCLLLRYEERAPLGDWLMSPLSALVVLMLAAGLAVLPIVVFAWPVYAWLLFRKHATYVTALAIPLIFSLGVLAWDGTSMAWIVALFGGCIAVVTHAASRLGPNNSFKPNLLRKSA